MKTHCILVAPDKYGISCSRLVTWKSKWRTKKKDLSNKDQFCRAKRSMQRKSIPLRGVSRILHQGIVESFECIFCPWKDPRWPVFFLRKQLWQQLSDLADTKSYADLGEETEPKLLSFICNLESYACNILLLPAAPPRTHLFDFVTSSFQAHRLNASSSLLCKGPEKKSYPDQRWLMRVG